MKTKPYRSCKLIRNAPISSLLMFCGRWKYSLLLFCIFLCHSLIGCNATRKDHNIILISLDTLRSDRLGCYGHTRNTSPHMDTLASQGILFLNARAQSSWTLPSHMSLFTSLYPSFHQVKNTDQCLSPHITTMAQILKKNGFTTAAFTEGGNLSQIHGFSRGFDIYGEKSQDINITFNQAMKWLRSNARERKFFLFIHTYENHTPYLRKALANPIKRGRLGETLPKNQQLFDIIFGRFLLTSQEKEYVKSLYDSGILYADSYIGMLLNVMEDLALMENTTLIVLSDHGEDLWDHGISPSHGVTLYEDQLRVPLIIYDRTLPSNFKIESPVQLIDIMPTLLSLNRIPIPPNLQGENLLPLIYSKNKSTNKTIFSEGTFYGPNRIAIIKDDYKYVTIPRLHEVKGVPSTKILFVLEPGLEERSLFNLKEDPSEKNNLIDKEPVRAQKLFALLEKEYLSKSRNIKPMPLLQKPSQEQKERLKALGYIQ